MWLSTHEALYIQQTTTKLSRTRACRNSQQSIGRTAMRKHHMIEQPQPSVAVIVMVTGSGGVYGVTREIECPNGSSSVEASGIDS